MYIDRSNDMTTIASLGLLISNLFFKKFRKILEYKQASKFFNILNLPLEYKLFLSGRCTITLPGIQF